MTEDTQVPKKRFTADWLLRGVLTKLGDSFDRFSGRHWVPSSSLATSELIGRIKRLLDSEGKKVKGKGMVVPHNIRLKMQWDKFSDESEEAIDSLRRELLAGVIDHINDSLYYTFAPVTLEVKRDYFIEGVKLYVSFEKFSSEDEDVEHNVTILGKTGVFKGAISENIQAPAPAEEADAGANVIYTARYAVNGTEIETRLYFSSKQRRGVGRAAASDLMLDDGSVSKFHASLVTDENGRLSIADTGSTNGTFINGKRIAYGKAMRLASGDIVKFGEIEVKFERITTQVIEGFAPEKENE